jgi:1,5-anhydro-D-fructose reductase (1,5-anhydro-D-mannitol-forming)
MSTVRWGMIGCGDVAEVKSGPALQRAEGSSLVAVMRRDTSKAEDYARRHDVRTVHRTADALVADPEVDAVYVATPPSSHLELARLAADAGKPCLVEKPMAATHAECLLMVDAFERRGVALFVAYYRRAFPIFLEARRLLRAGRIGNPTSVHIFQYDELLRGERAQIWRVDPAVAGAGLFYDLASHGFDLLEFLLGPIAEVRGVAVNTGGTYSVEDAVTSCFRFETGATGTGVWNFNADRKADGIVVNGTEGELHLPVFSHAPLVIRARDTEEVVPFEKPPHVHQPLVQAIVDELRGRGRCESTGRTGARASWLMEQCVEDYYRAHGPAGRTATSSPPSSRR